MTSAAAAAVSQRLTEFMKGKGDIARADLQRYRNIHQADQKRHGHEEDHDGAVGAEYLVEMFGWQKAMRSAGGDGLLHAHQDGIGEAAQQHDQRQDDVHDADLLVVNAGQPFLPQVRPLPVPGNQAKNDHCQQQHQAHRTHDDRVAERYLRKA